MSVIDITIAYNKTDLQSMTSAMQSLFEAVSQHVEKTKSQVEDLTKDVTKLNALLATASKKHEIVIDTHQVKTAGKELDAFEARLKRLQKMSINLSFGKKGAGSGIKTGGSKAGNAAAGAEAAEMMEGMEGGPLVAAASMALDKVKEVAGESIDAAMKRSLLSKKMEVMAGSPSKGRELMTQLRDLRKYSMVGEGVYENAQTMLNTGMNEHSVVKKIREIGDVGVGDPERMKTLTDARAKTFEAGKLTGEDLSQYQEASFNPLTVMADHWQDFGFKAKQTIESLKEMMEAGKISSGMVDKAFEVATGSGGKFHNMMDEVAQTSGGKMAQLKSNWEEMQVDIGDALMPVAELATDAASSLLHYLDISKTVPETLTNEKFEINSLVNSITQLNQGNSQRALMIDTLKSKYPDLFGNIDKEKSKNEDLLATLQKVNGQYDRRIDQAENKLVGDTAAKDARELRDRALRAQTQADYDKQHPHPVNIFNPDRFKFLSFADHLGIEASSGLRFETATPEGLTEYSKWAFGEADRMDAVKKQSDDKISASDHNSMITDARSLLGDKIRQKQLWGKNVTKKRAALSDEVTRWNGLAKDSGWRYQGALLTYDYSKLGHLLQPESGGDSDAEGNATGRKSKTGAMGSVAESVGASISGGGKKEVNINFKNFVERLDIHGGTVKDGLNDMEGQLKGMLYRILAGVPS